MAYETLLVEASDHVTTITLNRPDKRNSINTQMIADLQSALDAIEKTPARVVVLTGAGAVFCAGMDLALLQAIATQSPSENQEDSRRMAKMFRRIWSYSKPLIAAVNGHALAGGCGIATLCDFTIAVPEAKFGYTEVKIGFLPAIVSVFLTRQIGDKRARDLLLTGRLVEAPEAKELGLINEIVPPEKLMLRVKELAESDHRRQPRQCHPRQTPARHRRRGQPRRRPRARRPGKRPYALHPRFQGRPRQLPRKAQARLARRHREKLTVAHPFRGEAFHNPTNQFKSTHPTLIPTLPRY